MNERRTSWKAAFQTSHPGVRFFVTVFLLLLWGGAGVFAMDLSSSLGIVRFDPFLADISGEDTHSNFHMIGNVAADFDLSQFVSLTVSMEQDPVMMTRILPLVGLSSNTISLKAGPFIGFLGLLNPEMSQDMNPGVSVAFDAAAPGIVFGSIRFDTTISAESLDPETFVQRYWNVKAGFWVSGVIFSLGAEIRFLSEKRGTEVFINEWNKYALSADFFQKNVPWTFRFDAGLQNLKWTPQSAPKTGYEFNAIFVGIEFQWQINYAFKLILRRDESVYAWNVNQDTKETSSSSLLLDSFHLGMVWSIGKK